MKIAHMEICEVRLPMTRSFKTSFANIQDKSEVIIKLVSEDGHIGYGEAATLAEPVYTHETTETCLHTLSKHIAPRILGKNFETAQLFRQAYSDIVGNNLAKAGIECAFWHLLAQKESTSLKRLFEGERTEIVVGEGVGIKENIDDVIKDVESCLSRGFVRIKVKIQPGWDVEPIRAIRQKWPDIDLVADANAAYNIDQHLETLKSLDQFNLSMLEQPLSFDDFVNHARLQKALKTPICLDESIESLNDAETAIALGSCKIINIKPGRVGGILEAIAIHDFAEQNGVGVWCGGMLETGIGRAFNMALASKANFIYPADMSPQNMYYKDDLTTPPLELNANGTISVRDEPGLGYQIDEKKLEKYTINKIVL